MSEPPKPQINAYESRLYWQLLWASAISLIAVLAYTLIPPKTLTLIPNSKWSTGIFYDGQNDGHSIGTLMDPDQYHFKCEIRQGVEWPYCGMRVYISDHGKGIDLSQYDRVLLHLDYQGPAQRIRVFFNHYDPMVSRPGALETYKTSEATIPVSELDGMVEIYPHEWRVSDWWLTQNNVPRHLWAPDFSNIVFFGVDIISAKVYLDHDVKVHYLGAQGDWISKENWYLTIACIWLLTNMSIIVVHMVRLKRRTRLDSERLYRLANYSDNLRDESEKLKELSSTDTLTGVLNRNGFELFMQQHCIEHALTLNTALLVIDLDHFKRINDKRGHDTGDQVLKMVAKAIQHNIRSRDCLARWGGEEFVVLSPLTRMDEAVLLAEKLRGIVGTLTFDDSKGPFKITTSIGVGTAQEDETFESLFKRVDQALYKAKSLGRNCVVPDNPKPI